MSALHELEPQLGQLSEEVREAEDALLETLREDPHQEWTPRSLQNAAVNGWSAGVVSIAFWRLVSNGRLIVDELLRVRPQASDPA